MYAGKEGAGMNITGKVGIRLGAVLAAGLVALASSACAGEVGSRAVYDFCRAVIGGAKPAAAEGVDGVMLSGAEAFYAENLRYLRDGKPLSAGRMDCDRVALAGVKGEVPVVLHSRWHAQDGSVGVPIANWTDAAQHYSIEGFVGDLPARSWKLLLFNKPGDYDSPPEGYELDGWQSRNLPPSLATRRRQICAVAAGELRLVPTYVNCSVVWGSAKPVDGLRLEYRKAGGGGWETGEAPLYFEDARNYRGSIFSLSEDTPYEMRLTASGKTLASGKFRTWKSDVPVAKTVVLDPATAKYPIEVRDQGSPGGWIRYTAKKGAVLGGKDLMTSVIRVVGAKYVILEGLEISGGGGDKHNPIFIEKSQGVRVRNCEVYGYGRLSRPRFDDAGGAKPMPLDRTKDKTTYVNWDAAVMIFPGSSEVTVERCYLHDPRGKSNSWYYSHPAGYEGIFVFRADHSVVLRWNDIVGSDLHRWNDAIEGCENFSARGGFNRDADIYGNFCIFANDDCIELDGGQQNVRCFQNRLESGISDISVQGCFTSPVYVYDNLLGPTEEEFGYSNPCVKTSCFDPFWYRPYGGFWDNSFFEEPSKWWIRDTTRWDFRDSNVYYTNSMPRRLFVKYPVRRLPFILTEGRFDGIRVSGDEATPRTVSFKAYAREAQAYRVRKNFDADWFEVTPSEGVLKKGMNDFTVTFLPGKMRDRRFWRAAFLLRTPEGLSRCVSLYAERTDFAPPLRPVPEGGRTQYADCADGRLEFEFDVEEAGDYWYFLRVQGPQQFVDTEVSTDGSPWRRAMLRVWPSHQVWTMVSPGKRGKFNGKGLVAPLSLSAGRHTLKVRPMNGNVVEVFGAALSDDPVAFEPR